MFGKGRRLVMEKEYCVNLWGSHPEDDNDDCWTGEEYSTKDEAVEVFTNLWEHFDRDYYESSTAYVELYGPDVDEVWKNPGFDPRSLSDDDWINEIAMQAGMAFGCEGYNEIKGY
jgi:hypothetical protein